MADIFISYAREDREMAHRLATALEANSWSVWWDRHMRSIRPIDEEITEQLENARCVLVLWSSTAVKSHWVKDEAAEGRDRGILVSARIDQARPPLGFRAFHVHDLDGWVEAATGIAEPVFADVAALLGEQRAVTPSPRPSPVTGRGGNDPLPLGEGGQRDGERGRDRSGTNTPASPAATSSLSLWEREGVRASDASEPIKKDGISIGANPRDLPDFAVFKDIDAPWCPEMVVIPVGTFLMGSPQDEEGRFDEEGPQHRVTISRRFALGRYAVTFEEYDHFCGVTGREKPLDSEWGRGRRPVINVSWNDAQVYLEWLTGATGQPYRLPTEAEWEYTCRAGTTTAYGFGESIRQTQANFNLGYANESGGEQRLGQRSVAVGYFPANCWGLHEMHGNVWEWCNDCWSAYTLRTTLSSQTQTDALIAERILRGGCWANDARNVRSACRTKLEPRSLGHNIGFRCARVQEP